MVFVLSLTVRLHMLHIIWRIPKAVSKITIMTGMANFGSLNERSLNTISFSTLLELLIKN